MRRWAVKLETANARCAFASAKNRHRTNQGTSLGRRDLETTDFSWTSTDEKWTYDRTCDSLARTLSESGYSVNRSLGQTIEVLGRDFLANSSSNKTRSR